jgi:transposase
MSGDSLKKLSVPRSFQTPEQRTGLRRRRASNAASSRPRRSSCTGAASAAALIAEIGDITRFSSFDKLVAFAGVHAAEKSSGKKGADPESSWHMAKTGSPYLRAALFRIAIVGLQHNPVIQAHYARKRAQGKAKMNALGHCMKKALAIVWGVWRGGRDFDPAAHSNG